MSTVYPFLDKALLKDGFRLQRSRFFFPLPTSAAPLARSWPIRWALSILLEINEEGFSDVANFPDSEYCPHVEYCSDVRLDHRALGLGGRLLHHRRHHRPLGDRLAGGDQDLALQLPQPTFPRLGLTCVLTTRFVAYTWQAPTTWHVPRTWNVLTSWLVETTICCLENLTLLSPRCWFPSCRKRAGSFQLRRGNTSLLIGANKMIKYILTERQKQNVQISLSFCQFNVAIHRTFDSNVKQENVPMVQLLK